MGAERQQQQWRCSIRKDTVCPAHSHTETALWSFFLLLTSLFTPEEEGPHQSKCEFV